MKVISEPPKFKPFPHTCKVCSAELEVDKENDIQYYYFSDQRDGTEEYFFIKCPVCGEQLHINNNHVPILTAKKLKKEKRGW